MSVQELSFSHPGLGQSPDSIADGYDKHADVIDLPVSLGTQVVRQTQSISLGLTTEVKLLSGLRIFRDVYEYPLSVGVSREEFHDGVSLDVFPGQHKVFHTTDGVLEFYGCLFA